MWQKKKTGRACQAPPPATGQYPATGVRVAAKAGLTRVTVVNYKRMFRGVEYCLSFKIGLSWWMQMLSRSLRLEFCDEMIVLNEVSEIRWPVSVK